MSGEPRTKAGQALLTLLSAIGEEESGRDIILAIESEAAQAQGAAPQAEGLDPLAFEAMARTAMRVVERRTPLSPGQPLVDAVADAIEAEYARFAASSAPQALDVERLARAWFVGIQARSGIDRDTAIRRWNGTSDPDVQHLHGVYGDVAEKAAAEYHRLAPSEPTETGETPGRQVHSWTFDEEHETREADQP